MKNILTKRKKDGSEYHFVVELTEEEKKVKQNREDRATYKHSTDSIIKEIEGGAYNYFTKSPKGEYTGVIVKIGTSDDPKQKYLTTVISEGKSDNLLELPEYE